MSRLFLRFLGLLLGIIFLLADAALSNAERPHTKGRPLSLRCATPLRMSSRSEERQLGRADHAMLRASPSMASKVSEGGLNLPARSAGGACAPSTASFSSGSARR